MDSAQMKEVGEIVSAMVTPQLAAIRSVVRLLVREVHDVNPARVETMLAALHTVRADAEDVGEQVSLDQAIELLESAFADDDEGDYGD